MYPEEIRLSAIDRVLGGRGVGSAQEAAEVIAAAAIIEAYILEGMRRDAPAIDGTHSLSDKVEQVSARPAALDASAHDDLLALGGTDRNDQVPDQGFSSVVTHSESSVGDVGSTASLDEAGRVGNDSAGEEST